MTVHPPKKILRTSSCLQKLVWFTVESNTIFIEKCPKCSFSNKVNGDKLESKIFSELQLTLHYVSYKKMSCGFLRGPEQDLYSICVDYLYNAFMVLFCGPSCSFTAWTPFTFTEWTREVNIYQNFYFVFHIKNIFFGMTRGCEIYLHFQVSYAFKT